MDDPFQNTSLGKFQNIDIQRKDPKESGGGSERENGHMQKS